MRFIETSVFTKQVVRLLSDEGYRGLQVALLLRPEQGLVVPGGGGVRKLRWGTGSGGKRGGLRVLYFWDNLADTIYFLFVFRKNAQEDLSKEQLRTLAKVVREELR